MSPPTPSGAISPTCGPPTTMLDTGLPSFSHSSTGAGVPVASHSSVTGSFITTVMGLGPAVICGGTGGGRGAEKRHQEHQGAKWTGWVGDTMVWTRQYPSTGPWFSGTLFGMDTGDCMAGIANGAEDRGSAKAIFQGCAPRAGTAPLAPHKHERSWGEHSALRQLQSVPPQTHRSPAGCTTAQ